MDPRTKLLSAIDPASSRVEFSSSPIVLLCGGPTPINERPGDDPPPIASLRDAISRTIPSYEIFRPEEIKSWHVDGVYKNLVSFETDLASICSLVVIVLESVGALAELGAFSQHPELKHKIVAILPSEFRDDASFVNLGLLRHIAEGRDSSVKAYPWDIKAPTGSITNEIVNDVVEDIREELNSLKGSEVLKPTEASHVMALICELVEACRALKESEIHGYLGQLGASLTRDDLKRKLYLLQEFRLVKRTQYSDSIFYVREDEPFHKLRWGFREDAKDLGYQDRFRFQIECLDYYKSDASHRHRVRALANALGSQK